MMNKIHKLAATLLLMGPLAAHSTPILQIDADGLLTGATGVHVAGTLYDVEFVDGTCEDIFSGCDALTDFVFMTEGGADAASQALLDFVLIDGPLGLFDSDPSLTVGLEGVTSGEDTSGLIITPYAPAFDDFMVRVIAASNDFTDSEDFLASGPFDSNFDSTDATHVWARWTTPSSVPEPGTLALLGLGLAGMSLCRRRKGKPTSV